MRRMIIPALIIAACLLLNSQSLARRRGQEAGQETQSVKLATELVSLTVSATDNKGRAIAGLKKEDFKIFEDGVEQSINFFSSEESPASWGLVLDRSNSMTDMMQDVYQAALHVVDEGTDRDEMFIAAFNDQTETVSGFTSDRHKLENSMLGLRAGGNTALYDAVAFALDRMQSGKHRKKVLVVITDGEDNSSRLKFRELIEKAEERDALIYTVGMFEPMEPMLRTLRNRYARDELKKLAEITGAFAHFPTDIEQCRKTMKEIAREVGNQYSLGYYPSNAKRDGKWRKIRVKAGAEKGDKKYAARTRAGYYAPSNEEKK